MTWLFVPGTSSACAQVSEDLNLESSSPSIDLERLDGVWFTWRGKLLPQQAWSRQWKRGGFIRRLSGLTCEPSTLDRGVASFISSLRATPAKKTPSPESAPGPLAQGSSLPKSAALPKSAGLILSSARTYRGTRTDSLKPSSQHWKGWATALRQEYSVRPKPAIPCGASDCSSWPSPMAGAAGTEDYNAAGNSDFSRKAMDLANAMLEQWAAPRTITGGGESAERKKELGRMESGGGDLQSQAQQWSAPRATDGEKGGPNMSFGAGGIPLPAQAVTAAETYESQTWPAPAPASRDHKGSSATSLIRQDGKIRSDMLDYAAEQFFHPPSSPDQPIAGGSMSSTDSPNSNQPSARRKLNPMFVEALMRWPTGLSGFERQEMAWTRWWHVQRSYLSALYSGSGDEPAQASLF